MHHTVTLSLHQKFTTEQKNIFQGQGNKIMKSWLKLPVKSTQITVIFKTQFLHFYLIFQIHSSGGSFQFFQVQYFGDDFQDGEEVESRNAQRHYRCLDLFLFKNYIISLLNLLKVYQFIFVRGNTNDFLGNELDSLYRLFLLDTVVKVSRKNTIWFSYQCEFRSGMIF